MKIPVEYSDENHYMEFVADIMPILPKDRCVRIIDFGCGKSYLTFAMYYYIHELCGLDIRVAGLDLKADVISRCSGLAEKYGLIKERLSALVTDSARACLLEEKGYETQILEFIDMEHTPKNTFM